MKKITVLLIILATFMLLASCGKDAGDGSDKGADPAEGQYFQYTVIRGDTCAREVTEAVSALKNALEEASGLTVKMGTDYSGFTKPTKYEILVGITKRDESKALSKMPPRSFVIDHSSSKIVIIGGTNEDTINAVNYFIENYIGSGNDIIKLPEGEKYEYAFTYPDFILNGNDFEGYNIVNRGRVFADMVYEFRDKIKQIFGYEVPLNETEGEKTLIIDMDESLGEGKYKCYSEGEKIYVLGSNETALIKALEVLLELLPDSANEGEIVERTLKKEGKMADSILADIENASDSVKYFIVETDRDPLDYAVGDKIGFEIKLCSGDEIRSAPFFKWSISCEGEGGERRSGYASGADGVLSLSTKMDVPGFVMVEVEACDADGNVIAEVDRCSAGACASMNDIKVAAKEPEDWDSFWDNQLKRLDEVKPVAIEMVEDGSNGSYYVYDVKIACPGNEKWTGETYSAIYVSVPKNAAAQSLGIFVKFMGAGVRSTESHLSKKEGYICVSVNGHSIPSKMGDDYYSNLSSTTLKSYATPKDGENDPAEVFYSYMVMRDLQALRWVKSYFGYEGENLWDGKRLEVTGMSEGGYQALFTAALDPDVSSCNADVPAMCDKQGVHIGRRSSYGAAVESMLYYDACFFARRITCPVYLMVGLGDGTCVPSGITAMYNELSCDKTVTYVQNMGHTYPDAKKIQQRFEFKQSAVD